MAETTQETAKPEGPRPRTELWAIVAVAGAALICVCALAVALALILGRNSGATPQIQANPIINLAPPAAPAPPPAPAAAIQRPAAAIQRPAEPAKAQAQRSSAQDQIQAALPGVLATPTPSVAKREKQLKREEISAPPSPPFATPTAGPTPVPPHRVFFRVRTDAASLYKGDKPLAFPVRYSADAKGRVAQVFAVPISGVAGVSMAVDVPYLDSAAKDAGLDLKLSSPRTTGFLDGYRAPEGYRFFAAQLEIANQGQTALAFDSDAFDVRDAEGVPYLSNPELDAGLPTEALSPGNSVKLTLSFLVPDDAALKSLAVLSPAGMTLLPLAKK